ncbi:monovalent cation/H(+) antiporter subunit G [Chloroflexi bacterium TSY]|nr:monovalent cation/H(+) antiporter subunit G [Chloroflexi bacterium TSY]
MDFVLEELAVPLLIILGAVLMLIAAIGIVRMPDVYLRNSVSSKGATLGVAALMLANALYFNELGTSSRALAVIFFIFLTAPVAAHMLGRTAYRSKVPFWFATYIDADMISPEVQSESDSRSNSER